MCDTEGERELEKWDSRGLLSGQGRKGVAGVRDKKGSAGGVGIRSKAQPGREVKVEGS